MVTTSDDWTLEELAYVKGVLEGEIKDMPDHIWERIRQLADAPLVPLEGLDARSFTG